MTTVKFDSNKHVCVTSDHIDIDDLPFKEAIEVLQNACLTLIAKENPYEVTFNVGTENYYEHSYARITLTGFRDKTEEEIKAEERRRKQVRDNNYRNYLRLKKEFENE